MKAKHLSDVLDLPVAERLRWVQAIWDSIAESAQGPELTPAQQAELDRRLADYEKHPDAGSSWAEVKTRILKRS